MGVDIRQFIVHATRVGLLNLLTPEACQSQNVQKCVGGRARGGGSLQRSPDLLARPRVEGRGREKNGKEREKMGMGKGNGK